MVVVGVVGIIYWKGYLRTEQGLGVPFFTTRALSDASEGSKEPQRAPKYTKGDLWTLARGAIYRKIRVLEILKCQNHHYKLQIPGSKMTNLTDLNLI